MSIRGGVYHPYQAEQANKLSRVSYLNGGGAGSDTGSGWYKVFEAVCSGQNYDVYSAIILVNAVYYTKTRESDNTKRSGLIEIDCRNNPDGGSKTTSTISILCGNLETEVFGLKVQDRTFTLYYYSDQSIPIVDFVLLDDGSETPEVWMTTMGASYYGKEEPDGLLFGKVRNRASEDQDGNPLVNTATEQTITARKIFDVNGSIPILFLSGWERTGNETTQYCYLDWYDSNGDRVGVIGEKTSGTDRYGVFLQGGNEGRLQVLSDGEKCYFLLSESPSANDNSESIATTRWVNDKGYLTAVPAASQTVLGGVKVYMDSEGYLNIDTQ